VFWGLRIRARTLCFQKTSGGDASEKSPKPQTPNAQPVDEAVEEVRVHVEEAYTLNPQPSTRKLCYKKRLLEIKQVDALFVLLRLCCRAISAQI